MPRAAFALLLAAACAGPPPLAEAELYTVDTLALRRDPSITPAGAALSFLSEPYPAFGSGKQLAGSAGLTIFPAFAEGQIAAYMTTEVWENIDRIWVQPLYLVPDSTTVLPIFGVNAGTTFYSPYWQVFYYTPQAGVQLKSEQEVLSSGLALTRGPGKYRALTSDPTIVTAVQEGDQAPLRPLTGTQVGKAVNGLGYVDGALTRFVDLGDQQRFTWNLETLAVDETPLYAFAVGDASATPAPLDLPHVAGSGPPHAPLCDGKGNCSGVASPVPQFGALWRLTTVLLPPEADVYVPRASSALRSRMQAMGLPAIAPAEGLPDLPGDFLLRVAANGKDCFAHDLDQCQWLDSQNAIESLLPDWRVTQTPDRASCPLLLFNGNVLGK
jgi:hypothetical protein